VYKKAAAPVYCLGSGRSVKGGTFLLSVGAKGCDDVTWRHLRVTRGTATARNQRGQPSDAGRSARAGPKAPDCANCVIGVVLAEDSYMIREFLLSALNRSPEVEVLAACTNGAELERAIDAWEPDVVLTDIRMPPSGDDEGVRVAHRLRATHPDVGVVVLSQYAEPAYALDLLGDGTAGRAYLLKERIRDRQELVDAIKAVARGGSIVDPRIVDVLIAARSRAAGSPLVDLTPRELELLAEIAAGKSNGAIAESLVLTKRAVEKHVNAIFSKLNLPESPDVSRRVRAALIFLAEEDQIRER
jgi:DNA-binding NarL/FixJ family response regulator